MAPQEIKQERAVETRARILAGAAESFAEHGYAGSTISDIIKRSGVTKGALYFHFETKDEVADAIVSAQAEWLGEVEESLSGQGVQGLINLGYVICDALATNILVRAAARLAVERETFGSGRPNTFLAWESVALRYFRDVPKSDLNGEINEARGARIVMGAVLGLHMTREATDAPGFLHDELQALWELVLPSMVTPECRATLTIAHGRAPQTLSPQ